ncbi:MAG: PLP-dependent lyase/thiolase [Acidimicrobiales bacterium]
MNPFVTYREHLDVYHHARSAGLTDHDYIALVDAANADIVELEGFGFVETPIEHLVINGQPLVVKVETGNVGGSHKARHLFGLLLRLLIDERANPNYHASELAIASCGNAALGAGIVACAARRTLRVFVPSDASEFVLDRLAFLGATVEVCHRQAGEEGDPCVTRLGEALEQGATAFTVQGPLAPASIDGARTLGLELAAQLTDANIEATDLYIQIGGGALATATVDGLMRAGYPLPKLHPVQARNAHPYVAAWNRISGLVDPSMDRAAAERLVAEHVDAMVAWPGTPSSVAHGILDDVTYDWETVAVHQIATHGYPILVEEPQFTAAANALADQVSPAPDETGAAAVAGWMADRRRTPDAVCVALVTGATHDH